MGGVWDWLSDPANRETMGWLGGGAVVAIGGLWTAWRATRRSEPREETAKSGVSVKADRGGMAAGRDMIVGERKKR